MSSSSEAQPLGRSLLPDPVDDPVRRVVDSARDRKAVTAAVEAGWRAAGFSPEAGLRAKVLLVHYRPLERARLLLRVKLPRAAAGRRPRLQHLYVQVYPTAEAAHRRLRQAARKPLRCIGPPLFLLADWNAVAWAVPNGPMLRSAKIMFSRKRAQRLLVQAGLAPPAPARIRRPKLVRYVARRRAVFRWRDGADRRFYLKVYGPGGDAPAAANLKALDALSSETRLAVPHLLAHDERCRAVVMSEVPGRQLSTLVDGLVSHLREAPREPADGELRPIHGNLFGDQVLVDDALGVGIVDWDDLALGDPAFDLGRLVAHVAFLLRVGGAEAADVDRRADWLCAAHAAAGGGELDRERLRWHVATALLLRSKISALRAQPADWVAQVSQAVELTEAVLDGRALRTLSSASGPPSPDSASRRKEISS